MCRIKWFVNILHFECIHGFDLLSAQPNSPIMTLVSIEISQGQYCKFKNINCIIDY